MFNYFVTSSLLISLFYALFETRSASLCHSSPLLSETIDFSPLVSDILETKEVRVVRVQLTNMFEQDDNHRGNITRRIN